MDALNLRVDVKEFDFAEGRVLVFEIPPRPIGTPLAHEGAYLMRVGGSLVSMSPDQLKKIISEGSKSFLQQIAMNNLTSEQVISLLEVQTYFDLMHSSFPASTEAILARLKSEKLVVSQEGYFAITNLGACLLAKNFNDFEHLKYKAPRVIVYKGKDKLDVIRDQIGTKGYAVGFEGLIAFINSQLPLNEIISEALRTEHPMYPVHAIRELVANAFVHQDFEESGTRILIEIYSDRLEISNPGLPLIDTDRFIEEYKSRNEILADLMRRMGICEERSSGIDRVVSSTEEYQLPAPEFRAKAKNTTVILYAHKAFQEMSKKDKIRQLLPLLK